MKKLIPLALLLGGISYGQNIHFEDANFKKALIDLRTIDTNKDGEISEAEAQKVTTIRIQSLYTGDRDKITSIKGIEKFTNLTELNIGKHYVTSVDLSQNTKLKTLYLRENRLEGRLDISHLKDLTNVELNNNRITELILPTSGKIAFLYANDNLIQSIDVSAQTALRRFFMVRNQLTALNISQNKNLERLNLDNNAIEALDLSHLEKVSWISFANNKLKEMVLKNNKALATILAPNNQIERLNLQDNTDNNLTTLNLKDNPIQEILKDCNDKIGSNVLEPKSVVIKDNCTLSTLHNAVPSLFRIPSLIKDTITIVPHKGIAKIEVYNTLGQLVQSHTDASALPKGVYMVKITTAEGEVYQQKVIKD